MRNKEIQFERRLEHIAIAVKDINIASQTYLLLGFELGEREIIEEQGVELLILSTEDTRIELLQPLNDNSPVAKFIAKRGEGLHHLAFEVDDIHEMLKQCQDSGIRSIGKEPRIGAGGNLIIFLDPRTTGGVLIELVQHSLDVKPIHF
jgi:methylmalonyl-CoA epimerase